MIEVVVKILAYQTHGPAYQARLYPKQKKESVSKPNINPFRPSRIVKFSKLRPIFFNFIFCMCYVRERWVLMGILSLAFFKSSLSHNVMSCFKLRFNAFNPSKLSTPNFSLYNTYKIRHLVMRKWELIKWSKLLKIKNKILANLFNEKYELKLGEFNKTTGTERVNFLKNNI